MKFDFTDRETYLAWRAKWREEYKELSKAIRALKRCRKEFLRTYERQQTPNGPIRVLIAKVPNPEHGPYWNLGALRDAAVYQMELLKEAKELSWQMKQARLAAEAA